MPKKPKHCATKTMTGYTANCETCCNQKHNDPSYTGSKSAKEKNRCQLGCCKSKCKGTAKEKDICNNACKKKWGRSYAPEPSNQYELDSFEIGTESAVCENCGEIHGLDEYELTGGGKRAGGQTKTYKNTKGLTRGQMEQNMNRNINNPQYGKPNVPPSKGLKGGYAFYKPTSEPIPDYIMRALKPKKSVHPEYGKLRY